MQPVCLRGAPSLSTPLPSSYNVGMPLPPLPLVASCTPPSVNPLSECHQECVEVVATNFILDMVKEDPPHRRLVLVRVGGKLYAYFRDVASHVLGVPKQSTPMSSLYKTLRQDYKSQEYELKGEPYKRFKVLSEWVNNKNGSLALHPINVLQLVIRKVMPAKSILTCSVLAASLTGGADDQEQIRKRVTERMHERLGGWLAVCEQVSVFFCLKCLQCIGPICVCGFGNALHFCAVLHLFYSLTCFVPLQVAQSPAVAHVSLPASPSLVNRASNVHGLGGSCPPACTSPPPSGGFTPVVLHGVEVCLGWSSHSAIPCIVIMVDVTLNVWDCGMVLVVFGS